MSPVLLGASDMSAGPEDARGLRLASNENASIPLRDTEKLARLRRARKEAARDIEAERRLVDARVTELHAQLDAKLRERNERRASLLRLESERIGVEREVRFAQASAERADALTRLDAERGDEMAKKEARRAAFLARRRPAAGSVASAAEERWERINETAVEEAARTPRLRETRLLAVDDAMARSFRETNEVVAADEEVVAARESAAAVSAASPVRASAPPSPPAFEFAPPNVAARVASPSRDDTATRAARLGVRRSREDRPRRVANERGVLGEVLGEAGRKTPPDGEDAYDARTVESSRGNRTRVRRGGIAWTSPGARRDALRGDESSPRVRGAPASPKPSASASASASASPRAPSAGHTFSALGTFATDSPDPTRRMVGEEAEVVSRAAYRRVALERAEPVRRRPRAERVAGGGLRAARDSESRARAVGVSETARMPSFARALKHREPTTAETRDARRERRRGRRRPETRREKKFGKFPFRVAGAALDATRAVGGGALRGVGKVLRGLRGIRRGRDDDDAESLSP